jgi:hypothetical protein
MFNDYRNLNRRGPISPDEGLRYSLVPTVKKSDHEMKVIREKARESIANLGYPVTHLKN